jgi:Fe-S-cluster containining protein
MEQSIPAPLNLEDPCRGCGVCCMHMRSPPFAVKGEEAGGRTVAVRRGDEIDDICVDVYDDLPEELLAEWQAYLIGVCSDPSESGEDRPCYWFDLETRRCKHYEHRPEICREFEVGGEDCENHRELYDLGPLNIQN